MGAAEGLRGRRGRGGVLRRSLAAVAALAVVAAAVVTWSLWPALRAPGNDSTAARVAEWARDHGLGSLVVGLEKVQYDLHPPAVGGTPAAGLLGRAPARVLRPPTRLHRKGIPLRHRIASVAGPALPGEGVWRPLVQRHGQPVVQAAFLRPDAQHTSYLAGIVWMSHNALRFRLHPGFDQPGGSWTVPDRVPPGRRRGLVATWNGGFKLADAHGGFYLDGRTASPLVQGAASEVFYRNGTMDVGAWGREVSMTPAVVGVRQNLRLLVDHGHIAPRVDNLPAFNWGATIGASYYVFRSGVGVTAAGDTVYVSGDALTAQSLARLLLRAGAVRAMELDINPAWVSFMSYHPAGHPADPTPRKLLPGYERPADRYYQHTSRDFVTVYTR